MKATLRGSRGLLSECFRTWVFLLVLLLAPPTNGEVEKTVADDLTKMSLEDLMDIEITSVSKKKEKLHEAASAVYVITREDIRRSGAKSIPEAVRLAPGVQVARLNSGRWAITVRGFNDVYAQKLLVLIDGRTVYTPLFSGVYWDQQDVLLENVDRIEVIRGPGATLWGANAVNGVINIITGSAKNTQGGLLLGGAGNEERAVIGFRYGSKVGDDLYWRFYAKYFDRNGFPNDFGRDRADNWHSSQMGFRIDWDVSEIDLLTFQGDIYDGRAGQTLTTPVLFPPIMRTFDGDIDFTGGNLLGRWTRTYSEESEMALQLYYDHTLRRDSVFRERRHTVDLDFQRRLPWGERNEITWGLGYRYTTDETSGSFVFAIDPDDKSDKLFSAFLQDRITLIEDRLRFTLGTKIEHNEYTGFEVQPSARLMWTPTERQSLWAAVSRAVQTPSSSHHDMRINIVRFPLVLLSILGNDDVDAEDLIAYEIGYRFRPTERVSLEATGFYNVYDSLRTQEPGEPFFEFSPLPPRLVIPFVTDNKMDGDVYGFELSTKWQAMENWQLSANYSYIRTSFELDGSSGDTNSKGLYSVNPRHQISVRSFLSLTHNLEFDVMAYYVDNIASSDFDVPSYVRVDARLGWKPRDNLKLSFGVKNIFDKEHREFDRNNGVNPTNIERSCYAEIVWRF
ncbi:TonB-dependent receptor plug domain-containing protein [Candidatus Hydrogenedentota bacterium]